jgi:hypothetical protein
MRAGLVRVLVVGLLLPLASSARASPRPSEREDGARGDEPRSPASLVTAAGGHTVLGRGSGSTSVSLVGFTTETVDARREVGGLVLVGLPLDRLAQGSRRTTSAPPTFELAVAREQPFDLALTPRLARASVAAAWRASGLGADDARLDGIVSRARWSAALPEAHLRAMRWDDARLSLYTYSSDTNRLTDSATARVGLEGRLTWRLDRLVYADDEPAIERIRLEHRDARARVAGKVLEALFQWQRAALDLRTLPPTQQGTRDEADVRLRVLEAEAVLDVLTSGWFTTQGPRQAGQRASQGPRSTPYAAPLPAAGEL